MEVEFSFSLSEKIDLLKIARQAVMAAVSRRPYNPGKPKSHQLSKKGGAFVTLRRHGELRGCIGYIEPRLPVYETIAETAAKAAIGDPRFEPVTEEELDDIELEISVLSPLSEVRNVEEVVVGKHGLLVEMGFYRGLLLPQVATENSWNREQFLGYTCVKAGLDKDCYKNPSAKIYSFTAEVFGEQETGRVQEKDIAERT